MNVLYISLTYLLTINMSVQVSYWCSFYNDTNNWKLC